MATYNDLKTRVLKFCDAVGSTDAGNIAELALEETLRFISEQIDLPDLIDKAQYTWTGSESSVALHGASGFNITQSLFSSPNNLFVKKDTDSEDYGTPYDYVEYLPWLQLKAAPSGMVRDAIFEPPSIDERPSRSYTIDLTHSLNCEPVTAGNVLTLFYNKPQAAYNASATPELPPKYEQLLVNGAVLILKEWIREPDHLLDPTTILQPLVPQIKELERHRRSNRRRNTLHLSRRYDY